MVEKLGRTNNDLFPTFPFLHAMQRNSTLFLPSQQRLHKLGFLQKLGCQKPFWDQARLSSLINKQVVVKDAFYIRLHKSTNIHPQKRGWKTQYSQIQGSAVKSN